MTKASSVGMFDGPSFAFTEARIRQVCSLEDVAGADDSGRRSWRDDECRGLTLRLNVHTRTAVFCCFMKVDGKAVRQTLGDVQVVTLKEAREAVGRLRYDGTAAAMLAPRKAADVDDADDTPLVSTVADAMLAAHAAGRWLPGNRSKKPSDRTIKNYRDVRAARLRPHEGKTLAEFAAELPGIYHEMQQQAPVQANRWLQLVRNVFAYAESAGLWDGANPAVGTRTNRLTRTPEECRTRTLNDAEWKRLSAAMDADNLLWRDLFTMSVLTLQRMAAVVSMRWSDVTLDGDAAWRIPAKYMKGRKQGHTVPLADVPEAVAILRERRKVVPSDCQWVFPAPESDGPAVAYKTAWKRIITRAGLWHDDKHLRPRPHDLRRTGGARMTSAGVPLQVITKALGNAASSTSMVAKTYAVVVDEAVRSAFAATSRKPKRRR